jgi:hypothetical protein
MHLADMNGPLQSDNEAYIVDIQQDCLPRKGTPFKQ